MDPGLSSCRIIDRVVRQLSNYRDYRYSAVASAKRVIKWYNLVASRPPLVVMRARQLQNGDVFAEIGPAARILTEEFGVRVVIEGTCLLLKYKDH